jgi:branched-chain amino acid transport system permease protein
VEALAGLLIASIANGSIYALVALGIVLLWKAMAVFNFAQGTFMMLGAYVAVGFATRYSLWLAVPAALLVAASVGVLVEIVVVRPMLGASELSIVVATMGVSLVLTALVIVIFGTQPRVLQSPIQNQNLTIIGVPVSLPTLAIAITSFTCMALFGVFFQWSRFGLFMRATAAHYEAAVLSGIDTHRVSIVAWAVSSVLAAIGGILLANIELVSPDLGNVGLLAFPAVLIGGLRSIWGAVVGGILVGVLRLLGETYVSTQLGDLVVYGALLIVLVVRPYGLFGRSEANRV